MRQGQGEEEGEDDERRRRRRGWRKRGEFDLGTSPLSSPSMPPRRRRRTATGTSRCADDDERDLPVSFSGDGEDRLSSLPDVLRLHILSLLPLPDAIRTGVLSNQWVSLWRYRLPHASSIVISPDAAEVADGESVADSVDRALLAHGDRRLDQLSLSLLPCRSLSTHLRRWLEFAAARSVADFHLRLVQPSTAAAGGHGRRKNAASPVFAVPFPPQGSAIARLHLRGFHLSVPSTCPVTCSLVTLCLHHVLVTDAALRRAVAACRRLRILDIRRCINLHHINIIGPRLVRLTVIDCLRATELAVAAPCLRFFCFAGSFLSSYRFDPMPPFENVCLSSSGPNGGLPSTNFLAVLSRPADIRVLTLCSIALQCISFVGMNTLGRFKNFVDLKELQLRMFAMAESNLTDIYAFFRLCVCLQLEKLFIELPLDAHDPHVDNYLEVFQEEAPDIIFDKLSVIKVNGFKGHRNEMRLVKFLRGITNASTALVLVAPKEHSAEEYQKCLSDFLQFLKSESGEEGCALKDFNIHFNEYDDNLFRPTHLEADIEV